MTDDSTSCHVMVEILCFTTLGWNFPPFSFTVRVDTVHECVRQTDGRTDGQTDRQTELRSQRPCNAERRTVKHRTQTMDYFLLFPAKGAKRP